MHTHKAEDTVPEHRKERSRHKPCSIMHPFPLNCVHHSTQFIYFPQFSLTPTTLEYYSFRYIKIKSLTFCSILSPSTHYCLNIKDAKVLSGCSILHIGALPSLLVRHTYILNLVC
ncbi:hypothetical protein, unlikely [Trypanosoma brucei gambiense DAL972]|uniref:Uncharacterized protein n=1 Tax=Trypanosoma brucei gambiense (strain MHOM/CI/86/DAL972) TaxID=679716 RepID=C9ZRA2_TRYB9|nr:hypothetical protein, unlikely [Trypanosoma brucei gambiense DAL972]CBH11932.1 hypothetical protein, unlikely [Trypanosoma brucei gambiense DAL972]|eukprot:XP_011774217.1 hypothetical protein, unlikely [Trypanosoma brucei gambiense DAL972]